MVLKTLQSRNANTCIAHLHNEQFGYANTHLRASVVFISLSMKQKGGVKAANRKHGLYMLCDRVKHYYQI
jgi:hypothetical protein